MNLGNAVHFGEQFSRRATYASNRFNSNFGVESCWMDQDFWPAEGTARQSTVSRLHRMQLTPYTIYTPARMPNLNGLPAFWGAVGGMTLDRMWRHALSLMFSAEDFMVAVDRVSGVSQTDKSLYISVFSRLKLKLMEKWFNDEVSLRLRKKGCRKKQDRTGTLFEGCRRGWQRRLRSSLAWGLRGRGDLKDEQAPPSRV
jgi:hypothetical protein